MREILMKRGTDTLSIQDWHYKIYIQIKTSVFEAGWVYGVNLVDPLPAIINEWQEKGFSHA